MSSDIRLVICDADHTLANKERMLSERTKAMIEAYTPKSLFDKAAEAAPAQ
jgi:hydroxymethylpyrimidine pyrophosphatase-like HAD family hydrolase